MEIEDKKLLELAAKACGIYYKMSENNPTAFIRHTENFGWIEWNPLKDDGDAFRLSTFLELNVFHTSGNCYAMESNDDEFEEVVSYNDCSDKYEATRKAIVRAAAKIGDI